MTMMWRVAILFVAGCGIGHPVFECDDPADCGDGGRCEPEGHCSIVDNGCSSGYRFDDSAAESVAGDCVCHPTGPIVSVSAAAAHTCVVTEDGVMSCFGNGDDGRLGRAGDPLALGVVALPADVPDGSAWEVVAAGDRHSCGIVEPEGAIYCWGANERGQAGASPTQTEVIEPNRVATTGAALALALGAEHSCAVVDDGEEEVQCWGDNREAQLAQDRDALSEAPNAIPRKDSSYDLSSGRAHVCRVSPGESECWGSNADRQIQADEEVVIVPVEVAPAANATGLAAGGDHTCARFANSSAVTCWGANDLGQADPSRPDAEIRPTNPGSVDLPDRVLAIAAGADHSCAIVDPGAVHCWGNGADGPQAIGVAAALALSVGDRHACARLADGTVTCWGANTDGQLGRGTQSDDAEPAAPIGALCR